MTSDASLDWLISVDDHVLEPPDLWVDRVPAKDRDQRAANGAGRRDRVLVLREQADADVGLERGGGEVEGNSAPSL